MTISWSFYWQVFKQLLRMDLIEFRETFKDKFINVSIWALSTLIILSYITSAQFNTQGNFGAFMLAGCVATVGSFEAYPRIFQLVGDYFGPRIIDSYLILPIPSWIIFIRTMVYFAFCSLTQSLIILVLGKLLLWNLFQLSNISVVPLIAMLLIANIFFGVFAVWISTMISGPHLLSNVWSRFIFPLWFFGGFQYSWFTLKSLCAPLAYVVLANPFTLIMEGMRAALLGQEGYLNVWLCVLALTGLSIVCGWHSLHRLKRRLDYV